MNPNDFWNDKKAELKILAPLWEANNKGKCDLSRVVPGDVYKLSYVTDPWVSDHVKKIIEKEFGFYKDYASYGIVVYIWEVDASGVYMVANQARQGDFRVICSNFNYGKSWRLHDD